MQSGGGKEWDVFQDDDSEGDDEHSVSGERKKKKTATALVKMTVMPITIMTFFFWFHCSLCRTSRGFGRVLERPMNIFSLDDLDKFLRSANVHDMWNWAATRTQSSTWTVVAITSTTFFVDRLESFMGIPTGDSKNTLEDGQDTVVYEKNKTMRITAVFAELHER